MPASTQWLGRGEVSLQLDDMGGIAVIPLA
jgi:hypothetical protein